MSTNSKPLFNNPLTPPQYQAFHVDTTKLVTELYQRRTELESYVTQQQAINLFEQILLSGDITKLVVAGTKPNEMMQQLIYIPGQQADKWKKKYDELKNKWDKLKSDMIDTFEIDYH